jgi:hypothetical protein
MLQNCPECGRTCGEHQDICDRCKKSQLVKEAKQVLEQSRFVAVSSTDLMHSAAIDFAWQVLEDARNDAADSFLNADDETNQAKAKFAYRGYIHAMETLRRQAERLRKN